MQTRMSSSNSLALFLNTNTDKLYACIDSLIKIERERERDPDVENSNKESRGEAKETANEKQSPFGRGALPEHFLLFLLLPLLLLRGGTSTSSGGGGDSDEVAARGGPIQ